MVSRGKRWQRYCWFCREFWENRARLEGVEPQHTRIPDVPDQSQYCSRWFEFYQGYRIKRSEGASNEREAVQCEIPWRDTPPGYLPLSQQPNTTQPQFRLSSQQESQPHVSIEDALDDMLEESTSDASQNVPGSYPEDEQPQLRRPDDSRRNDGRNHIPTEEQIREARLRLVEAENRHRQVREELENAHTDLRACRERQRQLITAQQTARNLERGFGTREDVTQQGANYESPLSAMFARAQGWYQTAEEVRAAERVSNASEERHQRLMAAAGRQDFMQYMLEYTRRGEAEEDAASAHPRSLDDERIKRPPPKPENEMVVSLACKICLQQVSDTAVLPCGHLVMCRYCAAIAVPTRDDAQPLQRDSKCPLCRRTVKRVATIYLS